MKQNKKGNILLPLISGIAILAVLAGGFLWLNLSKMQKSENPILLNPPDIPGNNQAVEQIMISDLDDSWQLAVNEKYHYQIQVPKTTEGSHHPDDLRFDYQSTNHQRAFLGSISIGLVGMINESPEKFLGKMYPSPPSITTESLNGLTFYKTEARKDGSGTYYYTYFVLGPDSQYLVNLSAGSYSVFIDDNGRKYCSTMDGHGFACKVTLYETPEEMHLKIDHASY